MFSKEQSSLQAFYSLAAKLYCQVASKRSTITSLALGKNIRYKKKMYALLKQTHTNFDIISLVAQRSQILSVVDATKKNHSLICILIHDLLWNSEYSCSKKKLSLFLSVFPIIEQNKTRIRAEWVRLSITGASYKAFMDETMPAIKYVRINTLLASPDSFLEKVVAFFGTSCTITRDQLIPDLLCFEKLKNVQFHKCPFVQDGRLIVQDKASCLPALVLNPPEGSIVLDACAAPGNKTTHLAAIMKNRGMIYAIEQSRSRFELLSSNVQLFGSSISTMCINADFLKLNVEYILLDPSCSGSWMSTRDDIITASSSFSIEKDKEIERRIEKLASFQEMALKKAMSFPNVKRIVYSTCSILERENEMVVANALSQNKQFALADPPAFLSSWKRRGTGGLAPELLKKVLRTCPSEDNCHGFFVALFSRID